MSARSLLEPETKPELCFPVYPQQAEFLDSTAVYRGFVGGRGTGKSFVGAYDLLCRARPGFYLVAAPTYPMLKDSSLRSFFEVAEKLQQPIQFAKGDMLAWLPNGAEIAFRSAEEPDRLRGPNRAGAWLDEASLMAQAAFEITIASLRPPGGLESQMGWLSATFTPRGRLHWTHKVFAKGDPATTQLVRAATTDNPFLPADFFDKIRHQYSGLRARQELGGEFVEVEGAEWPAEYFEGEDLWFEHWPQNLTIRVIALDPSKGKGESAGQIANPQKGRDADYSAFVLLGRDQAGTLYVEADLDNVRDISRIIQDGMRLYRGFPADGFGVEVNQFQSMMLTEFERLSKKTGIMLPLYGLNNTQNKEMRIRRLTPYLAQRNIRFRDTPGTRLLVEQLEVFPQGDHDDGPDALEMAIRLAVELWNGKNA